MEQLKEILETTPCISKELFDQLEKTYGSENILKILKDIVSCTEKKFDDTCDNKLFYSLQLDLWNRYGYCFVVLHYYPFYDNILYRFKNNSSKLKKKYYSDEILSLEDEICYGFRLLHRDYISLLDEKNYFDIYQCLKDISDDNVKKYVISLFLNFYEKCSVKSNYDREIIQFLHQEDDKLCNVTCYVDDTNYSILLREIQLYFEYRFALEQFQLHNFGLIYSISNLYYGKFGFDSDDCFQEGYFGLSRACEKYDIRYGGKFSAYAYYWIKRFINFYLNSNCSLISYSSDIIAKINKIQSLRANFFQKYGREATIEEISEISGFTISEIQKLDYYIFLIFTDFLDQKFNEDDNNSETFGDVVPDERINIEEEVVNSVLFQDVIASMDHILNPKEKKVMLLHYSDPPMSFADIGRLLGCPRQTIQKRKDTAIKKLQRHYRVNRKVWE